MEKQTYNGWTNYATWRVNLEMIDGMTPLQVTGSLLPTVSQLRHALQEYVEEHIDSTTPDGLAKDYALAFVSDVDWWAIANNMLVDYADEAEEA